MALPSLSLLILINGIKFASQINNGFGATPRLFPYHAFITESGEYICGGGIIDVTHVLTAAHCVVGGPKHNLTVIAGGIYLEEDNAVNRSIDRIHLSPYYSNPLIGSHTSRGNPSSHPTNDIAVLTLILALHWGHHINPIALPRNIVEATGYRCAICNFAGLGRTGQLRPTSKQLQYIIMAILTVRVQTEGQLPAVNEFCAEDFFQVANRLEGDSGGPIICYSEIVGIFKVSDERPGYPQVFTSVYTHLDFINIARKN